jgi:dTDP-4-amino-4,6-dideoxygalactose transaminase
MSREEPMAVDDAQRPDSDRRDGGTTALTPDDLIDRWPKMTEAEARVAHDVTLRDELSGSTKAVRDFETRWKKWSGARYALTTASGSSALYCALFGLGVGPGDEVICPTYTWINSVGPALLLGARPVFCESDPETLLMDPRDVRSRITGRTRAIIVIHLWGHVCDMDQLVAISRDTGIPLVEDCSHAPGATYRGRMAGTIGSAGFWSLQDAKPVSAGEGGVFATDLAEVFERACLVSQGSRMGALVLPEHAIHQPLGLGMKLRAHPLGIAIAGVQLDRLSSLNLRRRTWVEAIERSVTGLAGLKPVRTYEGAQRAGFLGFALRHSPEEDGCRPAAELISELNSAGIPATGADGFPLLHRLPLFANGYDLFTRNRGPLAGDYPGYREGDFPATEAMHRELIFLPVLNDPAPGALDRLIHTLRSVCTRR